MSDSICDIINHVMETEIFPDDWKKAKVHPFFKSDERNVPSNYRPISILPTISKIIERAGAALGRGCRGCAPPPP